MTTPEASKVDSDAGKSSNKAVFIEGSTLKHVLTMTSTGAVGLVAIFIVDVLNLFYISLLGVQELAAAIGYASTILFFTISACIGISIAATAITAREIGAGNEERARKNATSSVIYMAVSTTLLMIILYPLLGPLLKLLGAEGETHALALNFMRIVLPSIPFMGFGMCFAALLRAKGDAKRAMYVTLSAGAMAAVIDPILIFGLDLGLTGAAIALVIVRILFTLVGWHGVHRVHNMLALPDTESLKIAIRPFAKIAGPAVLTQVATPVGNAYVTGAISQYGDDAVAGWAIIGRLIPLLFAAVFSLSGAIGPILSQNLGARRFDRISSTMRDSLGFVAIYCLLMWGLIALLNGQVIQWFSATGDAAELIRVFAFFVAGSFIFVGAQFVSNAAFNNLGNPLLSTMFNWGRATLGVIPFVHIGSSWGPIGVLIGWGLGGVVFGIVSIIVCLRVVRKLPQRADLQSDPISTIPTGNSPFTSGKGATYG